MLLARPETVGDSEFPFLEEVVNEPHHVVARVEAFGKADYSVVA